ncbi:hypothetical protein V6N13_097668 [Hibiscus sabdariffa]
MFLMWVQWVVLSIEEGSEGHGVDVGGSSVEIHQGDNEAKGASMESIQVVPAKKGVNARVVTHVIGIRSGSHAAIKIVDQGFKVNDRLISKASTSRVNV